jgi:hypothetical protein
MFATLLLGNGGLLATWEWSLVSVWNSTFTGVELAGGVELAAPVEKAATGPVKKVTAGRSGEDGPRVVEGHDRYGEEGHDGSLGWRRQTARWRRPRWIGCAMERAEDGQPR